MKKRTLFTAVLMTLALLLTVVTTTFAWYTAIEGEVSVEYDDVKVNATDDTFGAGDLKIVVTATPELGVGPSAREGELVNGVPQVGGTVYYYIEGRLVEINPVYKLAGKINFSCKIYDKDGNDVTDNLTEEYIATLSTKSITFTISESTSSLRFEDKEAKAVNLGKTSVDVTLSFDEEDGTPLFTNAYFAVNSSVELDAEGNGVEFALTITQ